MRDVRLEIVVADADYREVIKMLLLERQHAIGIKLAKNEYNIIYNPMHDASMLRQSHAFLQFAVNRQPQPHAIVLFDYEGSQQKISPEEVEADLEDRLRKAGWQSCAAIVVDPEIEIWAWSQAGRAKLRLLSKHSQEDFDKILQKFPLNERSKPKQPKEAMEAVLQKHGPRPSPYLSAQLAKDVSLKTDERAFTKLRTTLQTWFPLDSDSPPNPE